MATVVVSEDNLRIAEANIGADSGTWGNDGGGGGISDEPDIVFEGTTAQSRKVSTTPIGRNYTHGSGTDMSGSDATRTHYIAKINVTNYKALLSRTSPALVVKVGSSSSNYHNYRLFGNDNYPTVGGWQIIAICPSVSGYNASLDTGSPSNSSILYWSIIGDFSATSKAENVVIDAIDIGTGLYLTAGDGGSTEGEFQDFIDYDYNASGGAGNWGYVIEKEGVLFCIGTIGIGLDNTLASATTEFIDSNKTLIWTNGLVATGFNRFMIDTDADSTVINIDGCSFESKGMQNNTASRSYSTSEDSRTTFVMVNTGGAGTLTLINSLFINFASFSLIGTATTFTGNKLVQCGQMDLNGTSVLIDDCRFINPVIVADDSVIVWNGSDNPNSYMRDLYIEQGSTAHHAIEFGLSSPTTINITGMEVVGFTATNGQNNSTFHVLRTSGTVTINLIGVTGNFSYKSAGATVVLVTDPVTFSVHVQNTAGTSIVGARVLATVISGGPYPYDETVTITRSGTTASVSHTSHGMANGDLVVITGAVQNEYNGVQTISNVSTNAYDYTVAGSPTTPATGTIKATTAIISGVTNGSGDIEDTRSYSSSQPIGGRVRKSTGSPYYKTADIVGNISSVTGLDLIVVMLSDE